MNVRPGIATNLRAVLWLLLSAVLCTPFGAVASNHAVVGDGLVLACTRSPDLMLHCDYRVTGPGRPLAATASVAGIALPEPSFAERTDAPPSTAILLLVDTSDPAREPAIRRAAQHLGQLVEAAAPGSRFGIAAFDSDLRVLAPIGSDGRALKSVLQTLRSRGQTTELYRNVLQAIEFLDRASEPHKVIVVLSDGLAEDYAYFHRDVVNAALQARIAIYAIGYPRSEALSVGLQSLRRLAEETGGRFVAASPQFDLPEAFFSAPFVAVQQMGALSVDLGAVARRLPGGRQVLRIALETSAGQVDAEVPIDLPAPVVSPPPVVRVVEVPKVVEIEKVVRVPAPAAPAATAGETTWSISLWYWMATLGVLALALLALVLVLRRPGAPTAQATHQATHQATDRARGLATGMANPTATDHLPSPPGSQDAQATLVLDEPSTRPHPVTATPYRIGRLPDNDLVLRDPSVSRHHCEIYRRDDGVYQVLDLNSMNGVLLNGTRVMDADLHAGDVLEVGDVRMRFRLAAADGGADTLLMDTAMVSESLR